MKRRALLAFNELSGHEPEILRDIGSKARKRLGDSDPAVVSAAFTLADALLKVRRVKGPLQRLVDPEEHFQGNHLPKDKYHSVVSGLLDVIWSQPPAPSETRLLMRSIEVVTKLGFVCSRSTPFQQLNVSLGPLNTT